MLQKERQVFVDFHNSFVPVEILDKGLAFGRDRFEFFGGHHHELDSLEGDLILVVEVFLRTFKVIIQLELLCLAFNLLGHSSQVLPNIVLWGV